MVNSDYLNNFIKIYIIFIYLFIHSSFFLFAEEIQKEISTTITNPGTIATKDKNLIHSPFIVNFNIEEFTKNLKSTTLSNINMNGFGIIEKTADKDILTKSYNQKIFIGSDFRESMSDMGFDFNANLYLFSMINFNDGTWSARINDFTSTHSSSKNIVNDIYLVNVDRDSMLFIATIYNQKKVDFLKAMLERKVSYYRNYEIIQHNNKEYITFRLFAGQKIDFDNFLITEI